MRRSVILILIVLVGAGCKSAHRAKQSWTPLPQVCILQPITTNTLALSVLTAAYPDAPLVRADRFTQAVDSCLKEKRVLLVPAVRSFPVEQWKALREYLDKGGAAVFIGTDPFEARVRLVNGKPQSEDELHRQLIETARRVDGVSNVSGWRHENDSGKPRSSIKPDAGAKLSWPAARVEVSEFRDWDAVMVDVAGGAIQPTENSLAFHAHGDAGTSRLAVICVEEDGSHWFHVVGVREDWQPFVLRDAGFSYFYGGSNRGREGDRLVLSRVRKISIGLSMHLGAQQPGEHSFGISEVRITTDPRPLEHAVAWPDIMLMSPPFRRYETSATKTATLQVPIARPRGTGGERSAPFRHITLGHDKDRADMFVQPTENGATKAWAWVGTDAPGVQPIRECVRRLQARRFLQRVGIDRFVVHAGEKIEATACWTAGEPPVRAVAELIDDNRKVLEQAASMPLSSEAGQSVFSLGSAPVPPRDYTLRITLADARDAAVFYDRAEQSIKVFPAARTPKDDEWLTAKDGFFQQRGHPVFLLGINYWPLNHNGKAPGEYNAHWLEPGAFDPAIIRRDLDRLREVGINAVSIQYHEESQAPQLKWFVDECRKRGIWIHCFVGFLQPLEQNLPRAQRLIEAADLKNCPQVFAIDVAWEPHLGGYAERCRFDTEWDAWVKEQYGSIEHAEDVIGFPFLTKDGVVTGPSDEQLRTDGKHRAFVAVYRRFVDDYMSRRYGEVERLIRKLGCKQLLSARTGYGGTGNTWADPFFPIDLGSGAVHFDFTSPEGYALNGDLNQFHEGGFLTTYARGVAGGKPVAWLEFGCSVGANPQKTDLDNQARLYRNMFELCARSKAAACFGWWYPGGWRVDERSDMGVMNTDGTWRPVGAAIREFAARARREKWELARWDGREVNRDSDASGLSALWKANAANARSQMSMGRIEEVRPAGFAKLTTEVALVSVGDVPFKPPAPLQHVNAEWGRVETNVVRVGQTVRLELINTGPATWAASNETKSRTVWVRAKRVDGETQLRAVEQTEFGKRLWIAWKPSAKGAWELRPWLKDVGLFGQPLRIEVK